MDYMEDEMHESDIEKNGNGEGGIGENDITYTATAIPFIYSFPGYVVSVGQNSPG
jgi:hypothetical protein